jgi:uncharacterized protein YndB with AHSA1/START domain
MRTAVNVAAQSLSDKPFAELVIKRDIAAPRARVFAAWTDISQAALWWVPKGCTLLDCAMELRVGGAWRRRMRTSDGGIVTKHGVYREIAPPERLVFTYNTEYPDGRIDGETVVTVTLAEIDGRTRLTLQHVNFATEALATSHHGGWTTALDRFFEYMAESGQAQ